MFNSTGVFWIIILTLIVTMHVKPSVSLPPLIIKQSPEGPNLKINCIIIYLQIDLI